MKLENGILSTTIPNQFDGQIHSVEWFHNGEWRRIKDTVYPLQDTEVLDDTLDSGGFCFTNQLTPYPDEWMTDESGHLILDENGNKVENPNSIKFLKQLTPIRILWDSNDEFKPISDDMLHAVKVRNDLFNKDLKRQLDGKNPVKNPIWRYRIVDEVNIHGEGSLFKFTVKTVEATKLLELVQCDTLTFTRKLGHEVSLGSINIRYNYDYNDTNELINNGVIHKRGIISEYEISGKQSVKSLGDFFTPIEKNSFFVVPPIRWYWASLLFVEVYLCNLDNGERRKLFDYQCMVEGVADKIPSEAERSLSINQPGSYRLEYCCANEKTYTWMNDWFISIDFSVVEKMEEDEAVSIPKYTDLSVSDVLERILCVGETRRENIENQRFVLDDSLKDKFKDYPSPEFCITRSTFWEALKTVAGHVHCIPRLNWDEKSNSFRVITFDELGQMDECKLKAMHNNAPIAWDVRKSLDSYCGEINTYVDNLVNTKDEAMGSIVEPYEGGWKSARARDGELVVNSDTVVFNMSRPGMRVSQLEIKYNGKEFDITKYLFEAAEYKTLSTFDGTYPYSITHALKVEQGGSEIAEIATIGKSKVPFAEGAAFQKETIRNIVDMEEKGFDIPSDDFKNILYRVTYTPIVSARIVQSKPFIEDYNGYSRVYNVAGNTIESDYLGENLKGAIARLGNDIEYRTYMFERGKDVPNPGLLLDGKYIMKVTTQIDTVHFIKATLVLSSDYNQKNEYVAIDSNIRYYDVSEKQSIERHINYRESVVIGDYIGASNDKQPMISEDAVSLFAKVFSADAINKQISWVWFKGTSKPYGSYIPVPPMAILLPCLSQAEGNSLIFNFAFKDNYGAGYGITKSITGGYAQSQIAYGNVYGETDRVKVILGNNSGLNETESEDIVYDLPQWKSDKIPTGLLSTGNNSLIIDKDSREHLNFTIQLNMVVNRKSIILGSAISKSNPLVTANKTRLIACYWLPNKINKFATTINVTDGKEVSIEVINNDRCFYLPSVKNTSEFVAESIVWVDITDGLRNAKLIMGENETVLQGGKSRDIWFNFNANS